MMRGLFFSLFNSLDHDTFYNDALLIFQYFYSLQSPIALSTLQLLACTSHIRRRLHNMISERNVLIVV